MQDEMSQEEIDAILKGAMGDQNDEQQDQDQADSGAMQDAIPPVGEEEQQEEQAPTPIADAAIDKQQVDTFKSMSVEPSKQIGNINLLMDVPLSVSVELGRTRITIKNMLQLGPGSVIELDKLIGEPVDMLVNDRLIARGEVVVFDENFGIRITDIVNPGDRLRSLR